MKKGGYKIIDFKGTALSGTAVELSGIYDQIVDDFDKAILVSGVSLNDELQDDAYASVKGDVGSVDLTVYGGIITVTEDDEVTFATSKSLEELTTEIGDLNDLETTNKNSVVEAINENKQNIIKSISKTSDATISAGDANDAVSGWAYYSRNSSNLPVEGSCFVLTLVQQTIKCQIAVSATQTINKLYTRIYNGTSWTEWAQATNA